MNKIFQHGLGNVKIRNDTILHRANSNDGPRRAANHLLGFLADFQYFIGFAVYRHHRRFTDDDPFSFAMHQRISGAKINSQVMGKSVE